MTRRRIGPVLGIVALLSGCGGGDGGGTPAPPAPPSIGPTPPTSACSLVERQNWAAAQLNEWYLFPELLPAGSSPAGFATVDAYIDHLTAAARAQGKDRYFTYITSIAEENAYYGSGASAGFGIRLSIDAPQRRLFVGEAFEGAPALAAGIDRGTEILAIGTTASNLRTVDSIIASEGSNGVYNALGPSTPGLTRHLRVRDADGSTREIAVAKADYTLLPVSTRYGARIIEDGSRRVGYLNLRTFISTADAALRDAFSQFRAQGITEFVIDLRYNGGGLIDTAELIGDLLGRDRSTSDVLGYTTFRPSKSQYNETRNFSPRPQSVAPTRIAFIATEGTASASEVVMNSMIPWLGDRVALVGTDTYGKPVGQIGQDRAACDDRLRVVAFRTENRDRQGDYYNGLALKMPVTCQAGDDLSVPLGDPREASIATALDFLAGRSCAPIGGVGAMAMREGEVSRRELLRPARPTTVQREVPGIF